MAAPSRDQIEAKIALPKYKVEIHNGTAYVVVNNDYIKSVTGVLEVTANNNGLAFGVYAVPKATVVVTDELSTTAWELHKIRISFTFDTADFVQVFEGVITDRQRDQRFITFTCEGWNIIIARTKIYTEMFYRRPVATKTTISSIDNPNEFGYNAGLLNRIMWESGGRPYEQRLTYTSATFYYSFDESLLRPRWGWISGEDSWEEVNRLVKATGGQLYQDKDGVIYYKQPLSFGVSGVSPFELDYSQFVSISERITARERINTVKCRFIERNLQSSQLVYELDEVFLLSPGETVEKEFETKWPVYTYTRDSTNNLPFSSIKAVYPDGRAVTSVIELGYTVFNLDATRIRISFENITSEPITIEKIDIQGRPITQGSEGIVSYGTGIPELELESNPYIDSELHARRLIRMYYDFYNTARHIITLSGMGFDPDRYVGEVVQFDYSDWSYSGLYRITSISHDNTGARMNIDIVPIEGLPIRDDMFIIGTTYVDSDERYVSY